MTPYNLDEYKQRAREVSRKIAGRTHLYIEICEICEMPFIKSIAFPGNNSVCDQCKIEAKKRRAYKKKKE